MDFDDLKKDFLEMKLRNKSWTKYWEPFMNKYNCQVICELGVFRGRNFFEMIRHNPKKAVAIDSWIDDGVRSRNDGFKTQKEFDDMYSEFVNSVKEKPNVEVIRDYTFNAVNKFPNDYFDVVYIDADHSYAGCIRDLNDWYPKVKTGRFLIGDDYRPYEGRHPEIKFGVVEAVNDFVKQKNLDLYMVRKSSWAVVKT